MLTPNVTQEGHDRRSSRIEIWANGRIKNTYTIDQTSDATRGASLEKAFAAAVAGDYVRIPQGDYLPAATLSFARGITYYLEDSYIYRNTANEAAAQSSGTSGLVRILGTGRFHNQATTDTTGTRAHGLAIEDDGDAYIEATECRSASLNGAGLYLKGGALQTSVINARVGICRADQYDGCWVDCPSGFSATMQVWIGHAYSEGTGTQGDGLVVEDASDNFQGSVHAELAEAAEGRAVLYNGTTATAGHQATISVGTAKNTGSTSGSAVYCAFGRVTADQILMEDATRSAVELASGTNCFISAREIKGNVDLPGSNTFPTAFTSMLTADRIIGQVTCTNDYTRLDCGYIYNTAAAPIVSDSGARTVVMPRVCAMDVAPSVDITVAGAWYDTINNNLHVGPTIWPAADGTNGQVLTTNGSGTLSFATVGKTAIKTTAANYTVGTDDATESYGGVVYVTAAATITLPAAADGMSVTIVTAAAVAVSVDPNASDLIRLDGTALDDGDKITNTSTAGDIAVLTYYDATGWYAATNGWTDGGV